MKRLIYIVMMMSVALCAYWGRAVAADSVQWQQAAEVVALPESAQRGVTSGVEVTPHDATQAALAHARVISTVCESRPGRTISTHGTRLQRTPCKVAAAGGLSPRVTRQRRVLTQQAPLGVETPADYYVFALQRLLC